MDAKDRRARGGTRASEGLHIRIEVQRYVSTCYLPVIDYAPSHENILLRCTELIYRASQLWIRRSCSFLFGRLQIPARRELSFDTFLTGVNYMERVWHKNYG